jgi:hypothetical protein
MMKNMNSCDAPGLRIDHALVPTGSSGGCIRTRGLPTIRQTVIRQVPWCLVALASIAGVTGAAGEDAAIALPANLPPVESRDGLPPGWLPATVVDDAVTWAQIRGMKDRAKLYLPTGVANVRGILVNLEQGAQEDARELARAWRFANISLPWSFEYDLGHNDARSGRAKVTGLPVGNMDVLLKFLDVVARDLNRPELAVAPIVAWVGQSGGKLAEDLNKRAPGRCAAWADAWYQDWLKRPQLTAEIPVAAWWEFKEEKQRAELKTKLGAIVAGKPTPPKDLRCFASSYGVGHGFTQRPAMYYIFLDQCLKERLPAEPPPPGTATTLRKLDPLDGWCGDFNDVSEWAPIAPAREAKGFVDPVWLPNAYFAWVWRSYHTAKPDLRIVKPYVQWHTGKWDQGGKTDCGLGFDKPVKPDQALTFQAEVKGTYAKVEFHDGDRIVGEATAPEWKIEGVKLPSGVRVVFAVGVTADGVRRASRPAMLRVE